MTCAEVPGVGCTHGLFGCHVSLCVFAIRCHVGQLFACVFQWGMCRVVLQESLDLVGSSHTRNIDTAGSSYSVLVLKDKQV